MANLSMWILANMLKPLSLFIGLRYVKSRQTSGFSSFISASSTIGIAIGVMVLIVVLSAMNGFERVLAQKLLSIVPHAEVIVVDKPIIDWESSIAEINMHPGAKASAPVIKLTGMLQHKTALKGAEIRGVDLAKEQQVSTINEYIIKGKWSSLSDDNTIIIGAGIAKKLAVDVGDKIQALLPPKDANPGQSRQFPVPKKVNFTVVGLFKFGGTVDESLAYISLAQAQQINGYVENEVQGIRLQVDNVFQAPKIVRDVAYQFDHYVYIYDWTRTQGHLFNDIQLVRMVMFIVLVLVIAVASFNIVSTLIMVVNEKQSDIAILKTMGAKSTTIMMSFVIQGLMNGVIGCIAGAALGVYFANNLTEIVRDVEAMFATKFLSADVYFIDFLPSYLQYTDVVMTVAVAIVLSLLATLYPAWRATKIEPAKILGQS